jgi:hypothetical protein
MPKLISIAVESPQHYVAIDSEGHAWRGRLSQDAGQLDPLVIEWEPIKSDFPKPAKLWSGPKGDE